MNSGIVELSKSFVALQLRSLAIVVDYLHHCFIAVQLTNDWSCATWNFITPIVLRSCTPKS